MTIVKYLLLDRKRETRYEKEIIDYYNRYFPEESNKLISKNSDVFWLAYKNKEIVGVLRMITDYSRYALLLDLIVRKAERNQGIGKKLVKLAEEYCKTKKINHLILTTDSRTSWLTDFYEKLGFEIINDQSLMEYRF